MELPEPRYEDGRILVPLGGVALDNGDYTVAVLDDDGTPHPAGTSDPCLSIAGRAAYIGRARTRDLRTYRASCGTLRLRVRAASPYAEVERVDVGEGIDGAGAVGVTGVIACADREPGTVEASLHARHRGGAGTVDAPAELVDGEFSAVIPMGPLAAAHDFGRAHNEWDLWLRTPSGELRLGAHADDIRGKKHRVVYPGRTLGDTGTPLRGHPYYTVDDELSILLRSDHPVKGAV
ncbi:hypothetical protein CLV63_10985 [Murinocardiopsis flavida]|uniref:Uncharacterized protein n=1 Tax=Murinocardiopsis flavida TaxID=645275 RepID=A0A2P8DIM9_9ACTN|nr:hypothetical protein [Murinocardiopsis flavida]PSK97082.1 hypothetical protein CLV63_10985 [Murinocardiopsis flavida]